MKNGPTKLRYEPTFKALIDGTPTESLYVNVMQNGNIGDNSSHFYDDGQLSEVASHELGHALDIAFSPNPTPSQGLTYAAYLLSDLYALDYVLLDTTVTPNVMVRRDPCVATIFNGDAAPFAGVINVSTGHAVCVNGVLNPADFTPPYRSNSWILQRIDSLWLATYEVNAQLFAFQNVGDNGARVSVDPVLSNARFAPSLFSGTYFGCTKAWANANLAGLNGPASVPGSCTTSGLGYIPFQ